MQINPINDKNKIEELLNCLKDESERNYLMANIQLSLGLRIGEVLSLRVSSVADDFGTDLKVKESIKIKQNNVINSRNLNDSRSSIKLDIELMKCIRAYVIENSLSYDDYLFTGRKGKNVPITSVQAYRILKSAANQVGITEFGTQSLRKTFIYHNNCESPESLDQIKKNSNYLGVEKTLDNISVDNESNCIFSNSNNIKFTIKNDVSKNKPNNKNINLSFKIFDGNKIIGKGRSIGSEYETVVEYNSSNNSTKLDNNYCEEMSKLFYALYSSFKQIQNNEE